MMSSLITLQTSKKIRRTQKSKLKPFGSKFPKRRTTSLTYNRLPTRSFIGFRS